MNNEQFLGLDWYCNDWSAPADLVEDNRAERLAKRAIRLDESVKYVRAKKTLAEAATDADAALFNSLGDQFMAELNRDVGYDQTEKDLIGHSTIVDYDWIFISGDHIYIDVPVEYTMDNRRTSADLDAIVTAIKEVADRYNDLGDYDITVNANPMTINKIVRHEIDKAGATSRIDTADQDNPESITYSGKYKRLVDIDMGGAQDFPADKNCLIGERRVDYRAAAKKDVDAEVAATADEDSIEEAVEIAEAVAEGVAENECEDGNCEKLEEAKKDDETEDEVVADEEVPAEDNVDDAEPMEVDIENVEVEPAEEVNSAIPDLAELIKTVFITPKEDEELSAEDEAFNKGVQAVLDIVMEADEPKEEQIEDVDAEPEDKE